MNTLKTDELPEVQERDRSACEIEDGLVDLSAVTETKGSIFGTISDGGNGWQVGW